MSILFFACQTVVNFGNFAVDIGIFRLCRIWIDLCYVLDFSLLALFFCQLPSLVNLTFFGFEVYIIFLLVHSKWDEKAEYKILSVNG